MGPLNITLNNYISILNVIPELYSVVIMFLFSSLHLTLDKSSSDALLGKQHATTSMSGLSAK